VRGFNLFEVAPFFGRPLLGVELIEPLFCVVIACV